MQSRRSRKPFSADTGQDHTWDVGRCLDFYGGPELHRIFGAPLMAKYVHFSHRSLSIFGRSGDKVTIRCLLIKRDVVTLCNSGSNAHVKVVFQAALLFFDRKNYVDLEPFNGSSKRKRKTLEEFKFKVVLWMFGT